MFQVWFQSQIEIRGSPAFFLTLQSHDNLLNHMKTNWGLMHYHHWSLSDIEDMMPWERIVYIDFIDEKNTEERRAAMELESKMRVNNAKAPVINRIPKRF